MLGKKNVIYYGYLKHVTIVISYSKVMVNKMWILFLLTLMFALFTYITTKKILHPIFLFCIIWSLIFFLFSLNIYNIPLSDQGFYILLLMVISFPFGGIIFIYIKQNNRGRSRRDGKYNLKKIHFRKKAFWIICIFSIVIMFIDQFGIIMNIIRGYSFVDIIIDAGGVQTVEISGWKGILYIFIIYPASYFVSPICATEIVSGKNKKAPYLIVNLIFVILTVAHHGGRLSILIFIISYLSALMIFNRKIRFSKKIKKLILIMVGIAFIGIFYVSVSRGIEEVWESFYIYFVCAIPVMDSFLQSSLATSHTMGFLSSNGIWYPLITVLRVIGFNPPRLYTHTQSIRVYLESNWVYISDYGHNVNAFLPAGAYMFIDGGYLFELIGMMLCGYYCRKAYENVKKNINNKSVAVYIMIIIGITLSFMRFYGASYQYVIAIIYILFLYKKEKTMRLE